MQIINGTSQNTPTKPATITFISQMVDFQESLLSP